MTSKSPQTDKERLQTALDAAGVGVWDYDVINDTLIWSVHCYRLFGISKPFPITFKKFLQGLHPDDLERTRKVVDWSLKPESGGTYDIEYRTIGFQDGKERWLRATGKAYFNPEGKPFRFIGTLTDISAQKETEYHFKESEARFRNMADSTPMMIWMTNPEGYCTYLNKRWLDFTGQKPQEAMGIGWTNSLHEEDREKVKAEFLSANKNKTAFRSEYRLKDKKGHYHWMIDTAVPRMDEAGQFLGYIGSVLEISDRKETEDALLFRTAQLEAQNEAAIDGMLLVDKKGKMLSYNRRFAEIWGMPQEIIDNQNDHKALAFAMTQLEDPDRFIERVQYLYEHATEADFEELRFKNGKIIERWGRAVIGRDGTNYGWLWQFKDITQRKALQEELELRTAMLEAQNEGSPLGILVVDSQKHILYFNKRYIDLFEIPQQLVDKPSREGLLEYFKATILNYPVFEAKINQLYENQDAFGSRDIIELTNGKTIERYGYPIKSNEGRYYGWTWQFRDISAERLAEEKLQQKNQQLESLIREFEFVTDFMPQMVWSARPDGNHDFFNKRWFEYTGLDFETTKSFGWSKVVHPEDYEQAVKLWNQSLQTGEVYQVEYRLKRHDGAYFWFLGRATPLLNDEGAIVKWFGTCTDIDNQRRSAALLEEMVHERTAQLQEVNKNLERSNAELEQFAYVASHDLQEPLRKIRTFANLLEGELQREDFKKSQFYIERIWQSSTRMQELIKDLLDFSRLNRSTTDDLIPTDLNKTVAQVLEDLELNIQQKGAAIEVSSLPTIKAIPLQMTQLFYNLLNNALKFMASGKKPEIAINCTEASKELLVARGLQTLHLKHYHISIQDNGIGFKKEYAQQIFTIFQRLHNRGDYEGTGIGLALCKKVVTNHHGAIYAEGEEGKGATFHIILPEASII